MKSLKFVLPVILLSIFLGAQCIYSAWTAGQTTDETYYSASGYAMVRYNNYNFLGEHPPLMMQLGSLPLLLLQPKFQIDNPIRLPGSKNMDISRNGATFLYEMGNDPYITLFLQRLPIVLITILLGVAIAFLGRELWGLWGGLAALCLYAFDPNIIAHGSLFTTDLGVTAFYFFSIYFIKKFFDYPATYQAIIVGVLCGLTCLSKISGLVIFPTTLILFLFFYFTQSQARTIVSMSEKFDLGMGMLALLLLGNALGQKQAMAALGLICLLMIYLCFKNRKLLLQSRFATPVFNTLLIAGAILAFLFSYKLKKKYGVGVASIFILWNAAAAIFTFGLLKFWNKTSNIALVKLFMALWLVAGFMIILDYTDIFSRFYKFVGFGHFVQPLGNVFSHSLGGHRICIEGSFVTCDWRYFFALMASKTPLLTLALACLGLLMLLIKPKISLMTKALVIIPPGLFLGAAIFNGINIGLRHILPIYPFLFLWGGFAVAELTAFAKGPARKVLMGGLIFLFALFVLRSLRTAPDYLAYFNEAIGGPEQGAKLVADSNLNWGQDDKRLAKFVQNKKIPFIRIAGEAMNADIYNYEKLAWETFRPSDYETPTSGYYALGIGYYQAQQKNLKSWFKGKQPAYRVGKTFYIFEVF